MPTNDRAYMRDYMREWRLGKRRRNEHSLKADRTLQMRDYMRERRAKQREKSDDA
jgi:hypothetical protein